MDSALHDVAFSEQGIIPVVKMVLWVQVAVVHQDSIKTRWRMSPSLEDFISTSWWSVFLILF